MDSTETLGKHHARGKKVCCLKLQAARGSLDFRKVLVSHSRLSQHSDSVQRKLVKTSQSCTRPPLSAGAMNSKSPFVSDFVWMSEGIPITAVVGAILVVGCFQLPAVSSHKCKSRLPPLTNTSRLPGVLKGPSIKQMPATTVYLISSPKAVFKDRGYFRLTLSREMSYKAIPLTSAAISANFPLIRLI